MFQEGDQTHKVDVWSLFVTMLYAGKFRQRSNKFSNVDSAIVNPKERASAAQMLVRYFDGARQAAFLRSLK